MFNQHTVAQGALESQNRAAIHYLGTVSGWRGRTHTTDGVTRRVVSWSVAVLSLLCMPGYVGEANAFLTREFALDLGVAQRWAVAIASGVSSTVLHFTFFLIGIAIALAAEFLLFGAVVPLPGGHRIGAFMGALALSSALAILPVIVFGHVSLPALALIAVFTSIAVIVVFYAAIERISPRRRLGVVAVILVVSALGVLTGISMCGLFNGSLLG